MKISILIAILLISISAGAQKKKQEVKLTDQQVQAMVDTIPTKDGKILYDRIVYVDSSKKKEALYNDIRRWFVENFNSGKAVIQVDDIANGTLIGKGSYQYTLINGLNVHDGYTYFIVNVIVKDGKFRYQVYQFEAEEKNRSMLADANARVYTSNVNMDDCYTNYMAGKSKKYNRKNLEEVVRCQYVIDKTMTEMISKNDNASNF